MTSSGSAYPVKPGMSVPGCAPRTVPSESTCMVRMSSLLAEADDHHPALELTAEGVGRVLDDPVGRLVEVEVVGPAVVVRIGLDAVRVLGGPPEPAPSAVATVVEHPLAPRGVRVPVVATLLDLEQEVALRRVVGDRRHGPTRVGLAVDPASRALLRDVGAVAVAVLAARLSLLIMVMVRPLTVTPGLLPPPAVPLVGT